MRHRARDHVLEQGSAVEDIQELVAAADAQHRHAGVDGQPGDRNIQVVLVPVDVVAGSARLFAVEPRVQVAAARQHHAVELPKPLGRAEQHGFAAAVAHQFHDVVEEGIRLAHPRIGVRGTAEPDRNPDTGTGGGGRKRNLHDSFCTTGSARLRGARMAG